MSRLMSLFLRKPSVPAEPVVLPPGDSILVNCYATIRTLLRPDFPHQLIAIRDLTDPALAEHLDGFAGYVLSREEIKVDGGRLTRNAMGFHLAQRIRLVRHQLSMTINPRDWKGLAKWAKRTNSIQFLPDNSVRDPEGRVLIDSVGYSQPGAELPYPADALDRRQRTVKALVKRRINTPAHMPSTPGDDEVDLRPANEVMKRAMALTVVAAHADLWANGKTDLPWLRQMFGQGFAYVTQQEQAFLDDANPQRNVIVDLTWRYEALNLLLWALGRVKTLPGADTPAQAPTLLQIMQTLNEVPTAISTATLRPTAAILDALDMTYRLHWAVREARLGRMELPQGVNGSVISERHRALNWLTGFQNPPGAPWDEIDTPT